MELAPFKWVLEKQKSLNNTQVFILTLMICNNINSQQNTRKVYYSDFVIFNL